MIYAISPAQAQRAVSLYPGAASAAPLGLFSMAPSGAVYLANSLLFIAFKAMWSDHSRYGYTLR
jgi:hypothetical protein